METSAVIAAHLPIAARFLSSVPARRDSGRNDNNRDVRRGRDDKLLSANVISAALR